MRLRHLPLAFCVMLSGSVAAGSAFAQQDQDNRFDLKPLIPPVFTLPPDAKVSPGGNGRSLLPNDPTPQFNSTTQPPSNPGMRITIPTLR